MKRLALLAISITIFLSACGAPDGEDGPSSMNTLMLRHGAPIPIEYAGLINPIPSDNESLARGAEIFNANCGTCHGDGGMGDGPTASTLDPSPAAIAHTSQMSGDDYLFWRISEGGIPFETAMPVFKALEERARWDVINYVRALGKGEIASGQNVGGDLFDSEAELDGRTEMLAQAVDQEIITEAEADTFERVHIKLDEQLAAESSEAMTGNADDVQANSLAKLVDIGKITQAQADTFSKVHDLLIEVGLMR
ncbi:MAG: cytochrome c [Candidatus Promineifilaceae bacterium]